MVKAIMKQQKSLLDAEQLKCAQSQAYSHRLLIFDLIISGMSINLGTLAL